MYFDYIFYWVILHVVNYNFAQVIVMYYIFNYIFKFIEKNVLWKNENKNLSQVFFNISFTVVWYSIWIVSLKCVRLCKSQVCETV